MINIHHSFLPAFAGADPYARALARRVKLIGATAHYVTEDLDEGPTIEQDVKRVPHRKGRDPLASIGRDLERVVLARAAAPISTIGSSSMGIRQSSSERQTREPNSVSMSRALDTVMP